MSPRLAALLRALVPSLLPSSCALCGQRCAHDDGSVVCGPCHRHFVVTGQARCPQCANPVGLADAGRPCGACLARRPAYDATLAAADYAAPLDRLVLELKFGSRLALAPWFALALRDAVAAEHGWQLPGVLCPVPLGRSRLAERGFNQALEIARPLSAMLGMTLAPSLATRVRDTAAQSGVAPAARDANIRGAFGVAPHALHLVRGAHVGVVDDVMTSGATLDELAATLKRSGAARVSNLVFARTPPR